MSNKYTAITGALLLCVVGGKMSEGINFSDELGRYIQWLDSYYIHLLILQLSNIKKLTVLHNNVTVHGNRTLNKKSF